MERPQRGENHGSRILLLHGGQSAAQMHEGSPSPKVMLVGFGGDTGCLVSSGCSAYRPVFAQLRGQPQVQQAKRCGGVETCARRCLRFAGLFLAAMCVSHWPAVGMSIG